MTTTFFRGLMALFVLTVSFGLGTDAARKIAEPRERYTTVVQKASPTVVTIYVTYAAPNPLTGVTETKQYLGSGVYISAAGHVLSCDHLFEHEGMVLQLVTVQNYDGTIMKADVLALDGRKDLALIKVNEHGPYARIAKPGVIAVGQEVIAIGAPLGLSGTVTTGIVSATNRDQIHYDMLQMSAPINPGNSGGPLFNLKGEVVGINVNISCVTELPIWSGLGFSVSASEINRFLVGYTAGFKGLEKAGF